ncbi:MAG: cytochrome b/b6 domain-containing protein [Xanthomonadales bacterium]|nr:cytochrome b/b6 domain-containing protein [Xanthomonadales bacterium]
MPEQRVSVWSLPLRLTHWLVAIGVLAAWWTRHSPGSIHEWLGYAVWALVTLRLVGGVTGRGHTRFDDFVVSPVRTWNYARAAVSGQAPRYLGHNPLGGWMALVLWALIVAVCVTGWMYTTDRWWGIEWVENLHEALTNILLACVLFHVVGVIFTSRHQRENLMAAMIHGRKRPAGTEPPAHGRRN